MTNMHGDRFDLLQPGRHVLIQIPQYAAPLATLLRVEADVEPLGGACADMYIQHLNVTGRWADEKTAEKLRPLAGGVQYYPQPDGSRHGTMWMSFGKVELKVVWTYTDHASAHWPFLNFYARRLGQAGHPVGGLLGNDDHVEAATSKSPCSITLNLQAMRAPREHGGSVAAAALA